MSITEPATGHRASDVTPVMGYLRQTADPGPADQASGLVPGYVLADGRLRLLIFHGGPPHLQFWQAVDTMTGRHLALTLVDPDGAMPGPMLDEILSRTARLRGIDMPGLATVLEVARTNRGGVVVSEWIRGGSLREVANTAPSPIGAADAMQTLVDAALAAHQAGLVLSIDHPSRVRIRTDGDAVLAFPATMPDATAQTDLRGLGGTLYGLLVNRWPFRDQDIGDWTYAEVNEKGRPQEPASLNPKIPFLISATTDGLVRDSSGIRSAATVLALLCQAREEAPNSEEEALTRQPPPLPEPGRYADFRNFGPTERAEAAHRQIIRACLCIAAAIILVVLMTTAATLNRLLDGGKPDIASTADKLGLHRPSPVPSSAQAQPRRAGSAGPVKPLRAIVFSPGGGADNPNSAGLAIDGDPTTAWSTDTYFDAVPFPRFKPGVGLLLPLPKPTVITAVTVDLNSTGTVVQIRSSASDTPVKLDGTAALTPPTPMQPGHNTITVINAAPASDVLVWISTLGNTAGKSQAAISEITLQGSSPYG